MAKTSGDFQVFVKPTGPVCNLDCHYCYYLGKSSLYPDVKNFRMSDNLLENYIIQHLNASSGPEILFSWHGGEPTILGLEYFQKIIRFQKKHKRPGQKIINGIQTNATLLDEKWCRFLASEKFVAGISLDGPMELHNINRLTRDHKSSFDQTIRAYKLLRDYGVKSEILCVVSVHNVEYPLEVYRFFKDLQAAYITFLPLVESGQGSGGIVSPDTVPAEKFGKFLCTIFDEWQERDIGKVKIQIFEEAARTGFGQDHTLCVFKKTCGRVPVIEHNGDFYPCDHFVDGNHKFGNIRDTHLADLLESREQIAFGLAKLNSLPKFCLNCQVRSMCNGGCPKDRFIRTADGEEGLNYLCPGFKMFFTHCQPFVSEIAAIWNSQQSGIREHQFEQEIPRLTVEYQKTGRNASCPCGSGKKYKNCCMKT